MTIDYKATLNLPRTAFPMKANLVQKELEILDFWEKYGIYHKMINNKDKSKTYILHDGPPYANGHIHLGHTLNKILKDIIVKYKSMKGYYSPFVPGWDCHGLPIEHQVDKNLGSRKEGIPVLQKRKMCREYAAKFLNIQREEFKRLGVFGDWADPYITMSPSYEATIVREFGAFVTRGYIYKGKKPVHWCPTCVTALAEAEVEYFEKESPSIYVKFRVKDSKDRFKSNKDTYFVIWTTTPWTLPANMALTLHPQFLYCLVRTHEGRLIIAKDLLEECMDKIGYKSDDYSIERTWSGSELQGITCLHPWLDREVKTILGGHVTLEQGTGVVHTAPGHGEEDYEMGLRYGLEIYAPVDSKGRFTEEIEDFAGQDVFRANEGIIDKLREKNALLGSAQVITHSYPHCWRCKKPVIFRATEQWFISMKHKDLREKCLREIDRIKWFPKWGRDRIYGMIQNRPDWCISRQRAWGVPITLFQCEVCKKFITDKAIITHIEKEIARAGSDIWFERSARELLPEGYKCPDCGSREFSKETDILDVWFESGVSYAAVVEGDPRLSSPDGCQADLYLEGSDQHRGWFQSSLLASVGTRGKAPYRAVLTHGFVVDGEGKKMSKSLGNVISPQEITNKYGSEILRLWTSSADYREDMRISKEIIDRLVEAYRKIRNTCRFLLGNIYDFDSNYKLNKEELQEIDRFALSLLQNLIRKVNTAYENFAFHEVFHSIYKFCVVDMSAFYLDVLKDRLYTFKSDSKDRRAAQYVLYNILLSLTKMIAPILSFTAEEIWQHLKPKIQNPKSEIQESVFLSNFPEINPEFMDKALEKKWEDLLKIRDEVNKALEIKRQEKFIGNSLEAKVTLYVSDTLYRILEGYKSFLPTLFIVSSTEVLNTTNPPEGSYRSREIKDLAVVVERAEGKKCERCWNWSTTVGRYGDFPDICERCYKVLTA